MTEEQELAGERLEKEGMGRKSVLGRGNSMSERGRRGQACSRNSRVQDSWNQMKGCRGTLDEAGGWVRPGCAYPRLLLILFRLLGMHFFRLFKP